MVVVRQQWLPTGGIGKRHRRYPLPGQQCGQRGGTESQGRVAEKMAAEVFRFGQKVSHLIRFEFFVFGIVRQAQDPLLPYRRSIIHQSLRRRRQGSQFNDRSVVILIQVDLKVPDIQKGFGCGPIARKIFALLRQQS